MKKIIFIPGLLMSLFEISNAQMSVRWYEVDESRFFEVTGASGGSGISFYSQPQGGKVLRSETAKADGHVLVKTNEDFMPAFALNTDENNIAFYGERAFVLRNIKAEYQNGRAYVTWDAGVADYNNYEFALQKSDNGRDFETIHTLPAMHNNVLEYYAEDEIKNAVPYYRLQLIHRQTREIAYTWRTVSVVGEELQVFPTATQDELHYVLRSGLETGYSIFSLTGQVMQKGTVYDSYGLIDVAQLSPGSYLIRFDSEEGTAKKFIKL